MYHKYVICVTCGTRYNTYDPASIERCAACEANGERFHFTQVNESDLRDQFAMAAISGSIRIVDKMRDDIERDLDLEVAKFAYGIADAMMQVRFYDAE